jgi:(p)ppGpp synthase/HD superfamily hydrolase
MNIVQQAKEFAIESHGTQKYGKLPYEYHLQQVVSKLTYWRDLGQWNITDEMIAAAWLHDVLEDTSTSHTQLYQTFGDEITMTCYLLNKNNCLPRKYDYIIYIDKIKVDNSARLVKMADTLANLEASILSGELKRINKYSKQLALLTEL